MPRKKHAHTADLDAQARRLAERLAATAAGASERVLQAGAKVIAENEQHPLHYVMRLIAANTLVAFRQQSLLLQQERRLHSRRTPEGEEKKRRIRELREHFGRTYREIAEIVDSTKAAVKAICLRAGWVKGPRVRKR